ncbi:MULTISPECIES: bifunctional phosphopantothenoylcysteine decarboxylase/phosphopantothenate--cysteine ligase CoaBC [unclassified Agarivorans]|uniref:bifunctional phosphopantothenoylcysteine decarboxylase/phosphopantothenate--cysteine ligase CoaBC n=1 Tax=unclassified Agarivorans TaxID=2636026 RepID=UPI0026E3F133|nr:MULTISPECIES: bifunctional phosphopantothenoylcysteine decarboxylase/phosphopantothenate--cysteine ligase CoaBC [unclassified Agarivorans]MDO6685740.1 bifunctional phosphopantothenoylcysteine decarboxylase/phosphopantothenate--cysteine ligase CoaBC [Agarivorans sp. 3_MG-2023]MDO6716145.1 bifunctional phosphopantothenoylcysteine decarboxylase/phosphopantothenate--cysteine ligase CoaBC [Agarivorans sp. 2_MG-2023]
MLTGKKILLAITGGIAAYKMPELVRRLKEQGAEVKVVMTHHATSFITPLTLQAVSGEPVGQEVVDPAQEASMGHIAYAKWPDLVLMAPATANSIAKFSHGLADDLVSTLLLATDAPIVIAPAMNQQMYQAMATQANLSLLKQRGVPIWGPAQGEQACGDVGPGRMLEPAQLLANVQAMFAPKAPQVLNGVNVMITAGPTREAIDPVRYISNHSSGKMGFALAEAAKQLGASVTLVSGPVNLTTPKGVEKVAVNTAQQMLDASLERIEQCDIFIACAAVADYRVADVAEQKIKKTDESDEMQLRLVKNPDIVATIASLAKKPFTVGFAAETQDVSHYAQDKMARKNLDMIAANDVSKPEQGFNSEQNALTVFWPTGHQQLDLADKSALAQQLLALVAKQYAAQ